MNCTLCAACLPVGGWVRGTQFFCFHFFFLILSLLTSSSFNSSADCFRPNFCSCHVQGGEWVKTRDWRSHSSHSVGGHLKPTPFHSSSLFCAQNQRNKQRKYSCPRLWARRWLGKRISTIAAPLHHTHTRGNRSSSLMEFFFLYICVVLRALAVSSTTSRPFKN